MTEPSEGTKQTGSVLANRPFLFLVLAHGVSGLAFWGYFGTVFAEASYEFHGGVGQMATLGASLSVPFILGSLLQGLIVDKWSPKWLGFLGYLALIVAVALAWAAESLAWLYASSFVVGGALATIGPSRSALTGLLVPEERLVQANGAISVSFQFSLVVGTFVGGALLDAYGSGVVFAAAVVIALPPVAFVLGIPDVRQRGERPALSLDDLQKGARTAWRHPELRLLLLVTGLGWALINTFFVLEPLFIKQTLHQGPDAVLYLWGAHGAGALLGAVAVTRTKRGTGWEPAIVCAGVATIGVGILVYTGVGTYGVALVAAAVAGSGFALLFPPLLAFIQRVVGEEQRGRVTSVFVALQETMGLMSSLVILVFGGVIVVRPTLVGASAVLVVLGLLGLRADAMARRVAPVVVEVVEEDDEPAT
ncbi:MAG: MFS transporter [Actinobacteria bacterium]|nr:MFS transporter [Actinomycetota bacterium]